MFRASFRFLLTGIALLLPAVAQAYMGPALGLGIVGTVIAIVAVLLLSLFAFVFVPIRRLFRSRRKNVDQDADS